MRPFSTARPSCFWILPEARVELLLAHLADHDVVAGLRRHLRDAVPHQAAADDANLLDVHVASRETSEESTLESAGSLVNERIRERRGPAAGSGI